MECTGDMRYKTIRLSEISICLISQATGQPYKATVYWLVAGSMMV